MVMLARVIRTIAAIVAALIVIGILLVVLEANRDNAIVSFLLDTARTLVGPFKNLFTPDNEKLRTAINWGLAAAIYLLIGSVVASLLTRAAVRTGV